jgi:hypothetical protein
MKMQIVQGMDIKPINEAYSRGLEDGSRTTIEALLEHARKHGPIDVWFLQTYLSEPPRNILNENAKRSPYGDIDRADVDRGVRDRGASKD